MKMAASSVSKGKQPAEKSPELTVVGYDIASHSGFSANFRPENMMVNNPTDQASRWSTGSNNREQYICVKLQKDAIVHTITFGKYSKKHICNLKEFKVYGGMSEEGMIMILHSGLNNDDELEQFPVMHKVDGLDFVCRYIKIVPLQSFGESFNYSIWYMQIKGVAEPTSVATARRQTDEHLEREAMKLCLKHLRQRNHTQAFNALQAMTNVELEHPALSQLHQLLVVEENYQASEALLRQMAAENIFEQYIQKMGYTPQWTHIVPVGTDNAPTDHRPGCRGGHIMVMDAAQNKVYMMGGFNGQVDYSDFWVYSEDTNKWTLLSRDTARDGGPGPRACHKACFDPVNRCIYLLGRYLEVDGRATKNIQSDFYRYDVDSGQWNLLSSDTGADGGPNLVFDHQLNIDSQEQTVICYGGQLLTAGASHDCEYSDMFLYHVHSNTWESLDLSGTASPVDTAASSATHMDDDGDAVAETSETNPNTQSTGSQPAYSHGTSTGTSTNTSTGTGTDTISIKPRMGHSMVFDSAQRQVFIFHGKRGKTNLSDFYVYDLDSRRIVDVVRDSSKIGGPSANFTQRATIDPERRELYVLTGLMKDKKKNAQKVRSDFWVFSLDTREWRRVYENDHDDQAYWQVMRNIEPCPRYAHQLVYNPITKRHYMFGGNPGDLFSGNRVNDTRLDDFWSLQLHERSSHEILNNALFMIRSEYFLKICRMGKQIEALSYLQNDLAAVVDHNDTAQSASFRALTSSLFEPQPQPTPSPADDHVGMLVCDEDIGSVRMGSGDTSVGYTDRAALYEKLQVFFPASMKQPSADLIELLLSLKKT